MLPKVWPDVVAPGARFRPELRRSGRGRRRLCRALRSRAAGACEQSRAMVVSEFDRQALGYHPGKAMQRMDIYGVSFDLVGKQPIVLLKTAEGNRFLPIWIGHSEAAAILMRIQGASTQRPMTHDLLTELLGELEA